MLTATKNISLSHPRPDILSITGSRIMKSENWGLGVKLGHAASSRRPDGAHVAPSRAGACPSPTPKCSPDQRPLPERVISDILSSSLYCSRISSSLSALCSSSFEIFENPLYTICSSANCSFLSSNFRFSGIVLCLVRCISFLCCSRWA